MQTNGIVQRLTPHPERTGPAAASGAQDPIGSPQGAMNGTTAGSADKIGHWFGSAGTSPVLPSPALLPGRVECFASHFISTGDPVLPADHAATRSGPPVLRAFGRAAIGAAIASWVPLWTGCAASTGNKPVTRGPLLSPHGRSKQ